MTKVYIAIALIFVILVFIECMRAYLESQDIPELKDLHQRKDEPVDVAMLGLAAQLEKDMFVSKKITKQDRKLLKKVGKMPVSKKKTVKKKKAKTK